jgi:hypothetical protein
MFQLQLFFLLHCDEWDRVVGLPRHKFVTGATLLQLYRGGSRGGRTWCPPPMRNTPNILPPPSALRNFFKCTPPNLKSWIRPCTRISKDNAVKKTCTYLLQYKKDDTLSQTLSLVFQRML